MRASNLIVLAACLIGPSAAQTRQVVIVLEGDPPAFRVENSGILPKINNPNFENIFKVTVDKPGAPPLAGDFKMDKGVLIFAPRYRVEPGVTYKASFKLVTESATAAFTPAKPKLPSTTIVERVYPSAKVLPENELKFYIHFSAPMSRGEAKAHVHLMEEGGGEVKLPFLQMEEELWDRDFKRLTVLFEPGRVKRGLVPNQEAGMALKSGHNYTLVIDPEWKDAVGAPLRDGFKKSFTAGPAERSALDPKSWKVLPPVAGLSGPLAIEFPRPLDAALLQRFIDVNDEKGNLVKGRVILDDDERRWLFQPSQPWIAGKYTLDILSTLEDLAGNKIGRPFDVDLKDPNQQRPVPETISIPFTVGQ